MKFLGRYSDVAYALMRMVLAFLFMSHGYQRVFTGPIFPSDFPPLGVANVIEVILGPLLFLGLFTPIAAFIASGEMAVAYFMAHVSRGGIIPLFNMGEITVALSFGFLYIATRGGGRYSLDAMMGRNHSV
jgi:putative oxidoreductase